jgi:tetratricopeptide (TPR) repeat protein
MASSARIDELRKKFEENPRRYFAPLANEYRKAGQIDQAIAICREYLPQQPGHMSGHIVYGQALYEARQFEEAKGVFETALSLDPENLIALRHLGDIALLIGDSDAARTWYRRVLEADPRNEEIQAQLLSLEQATTTPSSTQASEAEPSASSAPTVVVDARQAPSSQVPPRPSGEARRQPWARKTPPPMAAATTGELPPTSKTLEIIPQTDRGAEPPPSSSLPTPASVPTIELDSAAGRRSREAMPIETSAISGLETTSLTGHVPVAEPAISSASRESKPAVVPPRLSLLDVPAAAEPSTSRRESGPFVTETMAELYLQQGHREEALGVYRALLEQRPGDSGLKERVATLESELAEAEEATAKADAATSEEATPVDSVAVPAGPTIREVLELIAQRRPGFRPPSLRGGNGGTAPAVEQEVPARPPMPRDALSTLFSAAEIASVDEGAALVLALAFTELNNGTQVPTPILEGAPAHRASNELSLDTVFGGHSVSGGNVSYDQFFAQRPSGPQSTTNTEPRDDVEHFTKWLEGLKRR